MVRGIIGDGVAFHVRGQLMVYGVAVEIDSQHRAVARSSIKQVAARIKHQGVSPARRGNARNLRACIGVERHHGVAHRDIEPAALLIQRQTGWLRGHQLVAARDLIGKVDQRDLVLVLQAEQDHSPAGVIQQVLGQRVQFHDRALSAGAQINSAERAVKHAGGIECFGLRYPQQPLRPMLHGNDLLHFPASGIDRGNAVVSRQRHVEHAAFIVHGHAAGIANLGDARHHAALHRAENLDGIGARPGEHHLPVGHGHLIEAGAALQVNQGDLAQLGGKAVDCTTQDRDEENGFNIAHGDRDLPSGYWDASSRCSAARGFPKSRAAEGTP